MCSMPSPTSLILVAVVTQPRDMEIARLLGWYRIPLRSAPKVVAVDYLAFYQTAAFNEYKWCIQYIAEVHGNELATRAELLRDEPDHPHAQQEYFKLQLGPLEALPEPIPASSWRRISFFYTTGEYMAEARTINDLVVREDERANLWNALHERAMRQQEYRVDELSTPGLDAQMLALLLGLAGQDRTEDDHPKTIN